MDQPLLTNKYNRRVRRDQPKLKLWRYAGLIITYKCSAACEFCYYNCGPDRNSLMPVETAIAAWQGLENLSADRAKIHITGGEPFLYFEHLVEIMTQARKNTLSPPRTIETNACWATNKKLITTRLKLLNCLGMQRLKISWDPFHAEFIDIKHVRLLAETASDILGKDRVLVRWEKYLQEPVKRPHLGWTERKELYIRALSDYPCRFTGRASGRLAELFADKSIDSIAATGCKSAFLNSKGIHIDPYGNVFNGLCSGIIVGNVNQLDIDQIWKSLDPERMNMLGALFNQGPAALLPEAAELGYKPKQLYAGKCHLCTNLRQFFFDIGRYKSIIGPYDCYFGACEGLQEN